MKKAWKTILIIALCILIVGEIVLGVGLATGGSPDRIWDAAYEHYDIGAIFTFIKSTGIADLLARIGLLGNRNMRRRVLLAASLDCQKVLLFDKELQSAARIICAPTAHKFHTCSLSGIFSAAHVA